MLPRPSGSRRTCTPARCSVSPTLRSPTNCARSTSASRKLAGEPVAYVCELKIDGLAIALHYATACWYAAARAATARRRRGHAKPAHHSRPIPLRLRGTAPAFVEVRGEVYLRKSDFERLNERAKRAGSRRFSPIRATPRPAASVNSIRR